MCLEPHKVCKDCCPFRLAWGSMSFAGRIYCSIRHLCISTGKTHIMCLFLYTNDVPQHGRLNKVLHTDVPYDAEPHASLGNVTWPPASISAGQVADGGLLRR